MTTRLNYLFEGTRSGNIPAEIRRMIYCHVFRGSRCTFDVGNRLDKNKPVRKGQGDAFKATDHRNLLLTCRQAYNEARLEYCAETYFSRGDSSLAMFSETLSCFTKAHLRRLENVELDGDTASDLTQLPSLQVCILTLHHVHGTDKGISMYGDDQALTSFAIKHLGGPGDSLHSYNLTFLAKKVQFPRCFRFTDVCCTGCRHNRNVPVPHTDWLLFHNYSTSKNFFADAGTYMDVGNFVKQDDIDKGFERVLR